MDRSVLLVVIVNSGAARFARTVPARATRYADASVCPSRQEAPWCGPSGPPRRWRPTGPVPPASASPGRGGTRATVGGRGGRGHRGSTRARLVRARSCDVGGLTGMGRIPSEPAALGLTKDLPLAPGLKPSVATLTACPLGAFG